MSASRVTNSAGRNGESPTKLTRQQAALLSFITDSIRETGIALSFDEMKDALGLKSKSGVHRPIQELEDRNYIRRIPKRARAIEVLKQPTQPQADAYQRGVELIRAMKVPAPASLTRATLTNIKPASAAAAHASDRIDPNGNHEPSNCRWATPHIQRTNQRARVVKGSHSGRRA